MSDDDPASKAALELFKNDLQHHETLSGFTSTQIQNSLRVSFLLNGAAIGAALTFYGAKGAELAIPKSALGMALVAWIIGLLASAASAGSYTAAQRQFQIAAWDQVRERAIKHFALALPGQAGEAASTGFRYRRIASVTWWLSVIAFGVGAFIMVCRALLA